MKMKKMLAILAALSVLGTTGLTVGAEDTATTTEPATEASTTTETEAETTAAETTAETEVETDVTEETAATEENQVVGKQLINKGDVLTFSGTLSYANGKNRPILNLDTPIEATVGGVDETVTYVRLNEESLTYADGARLTVTGTVDLTVFAGTGQNVVFLSNNTITENNATTTTTAAETTPTTTTTTTAATNAIIDQKTETMIVQGKPYALRFVLLKSTDSDGYCVSIYVDGKLVISRQPVGYFEYSPTSVSSYAGVSRGSVSEVTVTDWDKGTTVGTTTSFHYRYDPDQGVFVAVERSDEDSETTSAKEALYNKFVAAYGKPAYTNYGDFDQDGEPDAYFVYYDSTGVNTYFVTKDSITLVDKDTGDSMWSSDFAYFTCNGYRFRANLHTRITVGYAGGYITIERIEADGSLTKVNFKETVMSDYNYEAINKPNFAADLSEDFADKIFIYFSSNGDKITVTHYLYDDGRDVGSNSYVYDAATNSFVESSEAPTTTATTEDETTTTTTTTTKRDDAHPIDGYYPNGDFQLDGVTLTPKVEYSNKEPGLDEAWLYLNIYSQDGTLLVSVPADTYIADDGRPENYGKVGRYLVKTGSNTITVIDYSGSTRKYHSYVFENGKFVSTGTTIDDNQEKPLEIHLGDTMTVTGTLHYEWDNINENNNHRQVVLKLDKPITVTYMDEMENGFGVVRAGTTEVVDSVQISLDDELPEGTHLTVTGSVMYGHTGHHIRHIVLNNCTYQLDGKTDNGSASNAPASTATKNTSGTPKTGDTTTVPAVAVGLTLTAAGVVAFISKRKK